MVKELEIDTLPYLIGLSQTFPMGKKHIQIFWLHQLKNKEQ